MRGSDKKGHLTVPRYEELDRRGDKLAVFRIVSSCMICQILKKRWEEVQFEIEKTSPK
jgi:DNA-binding transcriptional regulator/RsmH inhibitor MraZ